MIEMLNSAALMWWNWITGITWQVSLLFLIVAVIDLLFRRRMWPEVGYALWLLVLLKLALPPDVASPVGVVMQVQRFAAVQAEASSLGAASAELVAGIDGNAEVEEEQSSGVGIISVAFAVWLAGLCGIASWVVVRTRRVLTNRGEEPPDWIMQMLREVARDVGLRKTPRVVLADTPGGPAVAGLFSPTIFIPRETGGSPEERQALRYVLLHEVMHVKRGDLYVQAAMFALRLIHWFNPLVWLAQRRLRQTRELACDASVAGLLGPNTHVYRTTLLGMARKLLERETEMSLSFVGLVEDRNMIATRLNWLARDLDRRRTIRRTASWILGIFMLLTVVPMGIAQETKAAGRDSAARGEDTVHQALRLKRLKPGDPEAEAPTITIIPVSTENRPLEVHGRLPDGRPAWVRFFLPRSRQDSAWAAVETDPPWLGENRNFFEVLRLLKGRTSINTNGRESVWVEQEGTEPDLLPPLRDTTRTSPPAGN